MTKLIKWREYVDRYAKQGYWLRFVASEQNGERKLYEVLAPPGRLFGVTTAPKPRRVRR